jgi:hypothetical protein
MNQVRNQIANGEQEKAERPAVWSKPQLKRLDAGSAEAAIGGGPDFGAQTS